MIHYARYAGGVIVLLVMQATLIPFIALAGVTPDLLLIFVIVIALREGQIPGTIAGFIIGLIADIVTGDFLGLGALTKTIAGFTAGYFYNEANPLQQLSTSTFLIVMAVAGIVHNIIHYGFLLQGLPVSVSEIFFMFIIGSTLYTVLFSLVPYFYFNSRANVTRT